MWLASSTQHAFKAYTMLQHVSFLCSFWKLNNIPLCGYTTFYLSTYLLMNIRFFVNFWLLWITHYEFFLGGHVFIFYEYVLRSKIGPYSNYMFNYLRNCWDVFQNSCTILHSYQQYVRVLISPCPYQCILLSVFLNIAILPRWLSGKESACQCRRCKRCRFNPWVGKIP